MELKGLILKEMVKQDSLLKTIYIHVIKHIKKISKRVK